MTTTHPHWLFDGSPIDDPFGHGERAVEFLRRLKHPKSTLPKRAFQLDPWQERIVRRIYGPRHPNGSRIVKTVVLLLPRGNRKTSLAAGLSLLHTIGPERVRGGEAAAVGVAARLKVFVRATSLGGVESLVEHRASVEGAGTPCPPDLLRLSIGLEDAGDLIGDLEQALDGV